MRLAAWSIALGAQVERRAALWTMAISKLLFPPMEIKFAAMHAVTGGSALIAMSTGTTRRAWFASRVGVFTDIVLIAAALCSLFLVIWKQGWWRTSDTQRSSAAYFSIGKPFPSGSGVPLAATGRNIILIVSTQCRACSESAGFYRRLLSEMRRTPEARLVVLCPQGSQEAMNYLVRLGLTSAQIEVRNFVSRQGYSVRVPSLIKADARGIVQKAWVGRLGQDQEEEALRELTRQ